MEGNLLHMEPKVLVYPFGDRSFTSTLYYGQDCRESLRGLPDKSVHCVVTSPPYFNLRDYGTGEWEGGDPLCNHLKTVDAQKAVQGSTLEGGKKTTGHQQEGFLAQCGRCGAIRVDQQIGMEENPQDYVQSLVEVFREVWRVLRDDGSLWLNLGDSYSGSGKGPVSEGSKQKSNPAACIGSRNGKKMLESCTLKPKNLYGIPWRVALTLQEEGWYLRSDIIWSKSSVMPESVGDRPTRSHEYLFLLTKKGQYFYDSFAVKEPLLHPNASGTYGTKHVHAGNPQYSHSGRSYVPPVGGRNRRSVWVVNPRPYAGAHFAVYPPELVDPCVKAGTSEKGCCPSCGSPWERLTSGDADNIEAHSDILAGWSPTCDCPPQDPIPCTVLDIFSGSGTTGYVANRLGRNYIGLDLNGKYLPLAENRILGVDAPIEEDPIEVVPNVLDLFEWLS